MTSRVNQHCNQRLLEFVGEKRKQPIKRGRLNRAELLATYCTRLCPKNGENAILPCPIDVVTAKTSRCRKRVRSRFGLDTKSRATRPFFRSTVRSFLNCLSLERRLAASRYYRAARGLIFAGQAYLARPYAAAAVRLEPSNQVYRRLLIPPPTAPPSSDALNPFCKPVRGCIAVSRFD